MNAATKRSATTLGVCAALAGAVVLSVTLLFHSHWEDTTTALFGIVGTVMLLWGLVNIAWRFEKSLRGIGAPLMLLLGFLEALTAIVARAHGLLLLLATEITEASINYKFLRLDKAKATSLGLLADDIGDALEDETKGAFAAVFALGGAMPERAAGPGTAADGGGR